MGMLQDVLTQFNPVPYPAYDFSGRTIIVTGANTGIGKEAVKHFLRLNASKVIGTARTDSKCKETLAEMESETPQNGRVEVWELEYGSYASVLSFCSRVAELGRVDNIILNAGVATRDYGVLEQHERHITVNVISSTLLAVLLLPVLQKSAEEFKTNPMLTVTGSKIYTWSRFPERTATNMIEKLNSEKDLTERYQVTKLLQLFAVLEIADRASQQYPSIIVNTMSPGFVATDLMRSAKGFEKVVLMVMLKLLGWTAEQGGRTLVECAVRGPDSHGVMLSEGRLKLPHVEPWILAEEGQKIQKQLWSELSVIIEAIQPGCLAGRRRKTKCKFRNNGPSKCDECYARGLICKAQGRVSDGGTDAESADQQAYSLRQRVSFLEDMVKSLVQNASIDTPRKSPLSVPGVAYEDVRFQAATVPSSISLDLKAAPLPIKGPILSLFHNDIMTQSVAETDAPAPTSKAENISCHLRRLLPASEEIDSILVASTGLWSDWSSQFPELWNENGVRDIKTEFWRRIASSQPVEVAKMLIFLLITIDNIPVHSFNSQNNVKENRNVFITQIERSVIQDIDFARTVPGTECIALLAKYLTKIGHLLSAWHLVRRAIEYAMVFGMQLPCSNAAVESGRKNLALWTSLCHYDSYLSLILGFPYCATSTHVARQSKLLLDSRGEIEYAEIYFLSVTTIMRRIIDRNQTEPNDLLETLKIDQDLDELAAQSPGKWWHLDLDRTHSNKMNTGRLIIHMLHHFIRALLHLPFLLQESSNPKQRLCYDTALASARSVAKSYQMLRTNVELIPYLGILADFQVFTMAILLIVHNARRENESDIDFRRENLRDWSLITDITNILRSVSRTSEENVAFQGLKILEILVEVQNRVESEGFGQGKSCKITIPCFGAVTISLGNQIIRSRRHGEDELLGRQSVGLSESLVDSTAHGQPLQETRDYHSEQQPQRLFAEIKNLIALPSMGFAGGEDALPNIFEYEPSYDLDHGWELNFFD